MIMTKEEFKTLKKGDIISNKYETRVGSICGHDYLVDSDYIWDEVKKDGYIVYRIILEINEKIEYGNQNQLYESEIEKCLNMHIKVHGL